MDDRRRYPRVLVRFSTEVLVHRANVSERCDGRVVVLGEGGAFLELLASYSIGSVLGLQFTLPTTAYRIACRGIVRNRLEDEGVGVEFIALDSADRNRIGAFIKQQVESRNQRVDESPGS